MRILCLCICLLTYTPAFAQLLKGKVVRIADGDTFTILLDDKTTKKVRFFGIDCPEARQDFGNVAKEFTTRYSKGKTVTVVQRGRDRYGRTLGLVLIGKDTLNVMLLKAGLAWHFRKFDKNITWDRYELVARKAKTGLWSRADAVAPWEWRGQKRQNKVTAIH